MKKKRAFLLAAELIGALILTGCGHQEIQDVTEEQKVTEEITMWCWDLSDSREAMHQVFTEKTGIKVNSVAVGSEDMAQKLQMAIANGEPMPDIAWLEISNRGKLFSLDIWEDITAEPYNFDQSQVLEYLIPMGTTEEGVYVGPEPPTVAGLAYKRELAKKYFGTDDPEELEKLLASWQDLTEAGARISEETDGTVFLFSSLGAAAQIMKGQSSDAYVVDDKLNLEESIKPMLEKLILMKQAGIVDDLDFNSAEEAKTYADDKHIFYPCANWSIEFYIKPNDPEGEGRWGFMTPPEGLFHWGGTVMGVPKDAEHKEAAVEYIKFFTATRQGAELQRDYRGNLSPYKEIYSEQNFYSKEESFFDGQDVLKELTQEIPGNLRTPRLPSQYDQDINDAFAIALKSISASGGIGVTAEELIDSMTAELAERYPSLE